MFLMDSESGVSERALAERAWAMRPRRYPPGLRVLLGGLGLGLTLQAILEHAEVGSVHVVELFAALIRWNRQELKLINQGALDDPRVTCHAVNLLDYLGRAAPPPDPFDLLFFDIDNGPTWLSLPGNADLYTGEGLGRLRPWLRARGVAAFWATERCAEFERCLDGVEWGRWSREWINWKAPRGQRRLRDALYFLTRES
jgi:spermidine synthase